LSGGQGVGQGVGTACGEPATAETLTIGVDELLGVGDSLVGVGVGDSLVGVGDAVVVVGVGVGDSLEGVGDGVGRASSKSTLAASSIALARCAVTSPDCSC
jgi:hypothetical protein